MSVHGFHDLRAGEGGRAHLPDPNPIVPVTPRTAGSLRYSTPNDYIREVNKMEMRNRMTVTDYLVIAILVMMFVCLFWKYSMAVEWHPTNQGTVSWTWVPTPDPPGQTTVFHLYTSATPDGADPLYTAEVPRDQLTYTFTFTAEGFYYVGVRTVEKHTPPDGGDIIEIESTIIWSDSTVEVDVPETFGFFFNVPPDAPKGLSRDE